MMEGVLSHFDYLQGKGKKKERAVEQGCVPETLVAKVLTSLHDDVTAGHLGIAKSYHLDRSTYYWWGMAKDIRNYFRSCHSCQSGKRPPKPTRAPLQALQILEKPFEKLAVDCIGLLKTTDRGIKYLVIFICHLTRYVEAFAVPDIKAITISRLFGEIT